MFNFMIFDNQYKFMELYCSMYFNLYPMFKLASKILVVFSFNILKLYTMLVNSKLFIFNNNLINYIIKLVTSFKALFSYLNKRYFKFSKKYKNLYSISVVSYWSIFFILTMFSFLVLMLKNKSSYRKLFMMLYIAMFYVFMYMWCFAMVPLFYYKFLGMIMAMYMFFLYYGLKML